ncbi:TPA: hypothetical protein N0F65_011278 [Lagenidium giganteum]|uniref:PA domain-containing protein n=1 Tax=Lagenidium giganteum TaxID=4803 RepID=A0AAV2YXX1_9STRA|nr:TPA: hypothetical protein N0F65_011278 [Lagenidium giganteum]
MKASMWRVAALAWSATVALARGNGATGPADEPHWGRIYLRNGVAPIQYFRDSFSGPMVPHEVEFVFPKRDEDREGCAMLPDDEQEAIRAANGTAVLVVDRGTCTFELKSRNAQAMGAGGLVVVSLSDDVKAPVALVEGEDIEMPSLAVRRSGGQLLRAVGSRERLFGRIIPMTCTRKPYQCQPRRDVEKQYVSSATVRSGFVLAASSNETLGEFLAATYGGVLPTKALDIAHDVESTDGCNATTSGVDMKGMAVLVSGDKGACSVLERVTHAESAGAAMALIVSSSNASFARPTVQESWEGYNVTIPTIVITDALRDKLVEQRDSPSADGVKRGIRFQRQNEIADVWDEIRKLSVASSWPARTARREKLVQRLLSSAWVDDAHVKAIKRAFLDVGGGSVASWDRLSAPAVDESSAREPAENLPGAVVKEEL